MLKAANSAGVSEP
jgi:hypothetical protein